jgi:hypothetical protein
MINPYLQERYFNLSNLTIVANSSRTMISKALGSGFAASQVEISSYLVLSLCFKEYCRTTNLAIDLLNIDDFEVISCYYNKLAKSPPDRQLLIFSNTQAKQILERVGAGIRSIACDNKS